MLLMLLRFVLRKCVNHLGVVAVAMSFMCEGA